MAADRPFSRAITKNVLVTKSLLGRPKEILETPGKHLNLTRAGEKYANEVFEKHCLLKEFLLSLGVSEQTAEADACSMEHVLSPETVLAIKTKMGK